MNGKILCIILMPLWNVSKLYVIEEYSKLDYCENMNVIYNNLVKI